MINNRFIFLVFIACKGILLYSMIALILAFVEIQRTKPFNDLATLFYVRFPAGLGTFGGVVGITFGLVSKEKVNQRLVNRNLFLVLIAFIVTVVLLYLLQSFF